MKKQLVAAGMIVATALGLGLSAAPAGAENVNATVNGGLRTATVSELNLAPIVSSHDIQSQPGQVRVTVDDSTATGSGWTVTLVASDFSGPQVIPASNFHSFWATPPSRVAGQDVDPVGGPYYSSEVLGSLDTPRTLMSADPMFGRGTYTQDIGVLLDFPADVLAGSYTTTLTVSITAAP